jgi:ElaB protein
MPPGRRSPKATPRAANIEYPALSCSREARHLLTLGLFNQKMEVQMAEYQPTTSAGPADLSQDDKSFAAKPNGSDLEGPDLGAALSRLKDDFVGAQEAVKAKYRIVSESTDDFVHESPWKGVALAFIGGLIIGLLVSR